MRTNSINIPFLLFPVFIFLCSVNHVVFSQNADAELWTGIELSRTMAKSLSLGFEEEMRINDNISSVKTVFSQLSCSYRLSKHIRAKAAYRFAQKPLDIGGFSIRHRFNLDITLKYKWQSLIIYWRSRYQIGYKDLYSDYNKNNADQYNRNRLIFKYDMDKAVMPYTGIETFYQLGNPAGNVLDAFRYYAGIYYTMNDNQSLKIGYIFEKPLDGINPMNSHIWSVGYSFSLDRSQ